MPEETKNVTISIDKQIISKQTLVDKIMETISSIFSTSNFNIGLKNKSVIANANISKDNFQLNISKHQEKEEKDDNKVT